MKSVAFGFVLVLAIVGIVIFLLPRAENAQRVTVRVGSGRIDAELAQTQNKREHGLMHRDHLAENSGMLFLFSESRPPAGGQIFWNKNTLIPLDIIWVQNKRVVGISQLPAIADGLKTVSSQNNVDAVLEVNLGWAEKHGIKIGDALEW